MTEMLPTAGASEPPDRAALLHAIYRIALEPRSYDVFMDHWDSHLSHALAELAALHDEASLTDPEIDGHFSTAFGILQELGRPDQTRPTDGEGPRLLVDGNGQVVWLNQAAAEAFNLETRSQIDVLDAYAAAPGTTRRMVRDLMELAAGAQGGQRILRLDLPDRTIFQIVRSVTDLDRERLILIAPLMTGASPEAGSLLKATFGLTDAEVSVAAALAEGQRPEQIALQRGVSVHTVRSQIKVLLSKTGAAGQIELVRLLLAIDGVLDKSSTAPLGRAEPLVVTTASGRPMPVEFHGPAHGVPVVFLHGMLDGCTLTKSIEQSLERNGIRLIVPIRPGFGLAKADTGPVATAPDRLAADLATLLEQFGLRRVVLLGHMAGACYAFAAAALLKHRVAGLVSVAGGVPIRSVAQFSTMAKRQRLVAYTARYTSSALPFVLRAGIRQLDFNCARNFTSALYESSPHDLAMTSDPDVFRALQSGYEFAVAQGHSAFETDSYHVVRDWSVSVRASRIPVVLIHGRHDPVVSASSVEAFAKSLGSRAIIDVRPDCGQLVFYRAPDAVFSAASRLFETRSERVCSTNSGATSHF